MLQSTDVAKTMRVLVTGSAGLVGRHVVAALAARGVDAVALDAGFTGQAMAGAETVQADVRDRESLTRLLAKNRVDRIIHCAGVLQGTCQEQPERGVSVNVLGTLNVFEAAYRVGVERVVFASSIAVYGRTRVSPMTEQHPCEPQGIYATSKLLGEQLAQAFERTVGLEYLVARYGLVYGPWHVQTKGVAAEFSDLLARVVRDGIIRIPAAKQMYPLVYVSDAAEATVEACLRVPTPSHRIFNISGQGHTMDEVAEILSGFYPNARVQRDPEYKVSPINGDLDIGLARSELGFTPAVSLREGLKKTCQFLEASSRSGRRIEQVSAQEAWPTPF